MTISHSQWLEERKKGIGGSDSAAILGLSKWKTPYQVWLEKTNQSDEFFDNEAMFWGRMLEPVIIEHYSNITGLSITKAELYKMPEYPFIFANVDGLPVEDITRILEIKTSRTSQDWGEEGTDDIPFEYLCQCQHYLMVYKRKVVDVAVLIGGSDFRIYHVYEDKELQELMLKEYHKFWFMVENNIPPAPTKFSDVVIRFKLSNAGEIKASETIIQFIERLKLLKSRIEVMQSESEDLKTRIAEYMGENELLTYSDKPLVTWKKTTPRITLNSSLLKQEHPEIFAKYSKLSEQSRTFLIK